MAGARLDAGQTLTARARDRRPDRREVSSGARFENADCSADLEKNQSMGLMRATFKSADLRRADLSRANLARADLRFAKLSVANLAGATHCARRSASGADLRGRLFFKTPTRPAWMSIPRASTAPAFPILQRRPTSIAPSASERDRADAASQARKGRPLGRAPSGALL